MERSTNNSKKLAVFDVCETLYYSNTTHDFIAFVVVQTEYSSFARLMFLLLFGKLSPFRYALIGFSIFTGWDFSRSIALRFLRGLSPSEMDNFADKFVTSFLVNAEITETQNLLKELRAAGSLVVLCSSSIKPVVDAIGRKLGDIDVIGSKLEFEGGVFSGRIVDDTTGRKIDHLRRSYPNAEIEWAVSDNVSDKDLLLAAEHPVAVVHNYRKLAFWQQYEFEVVDLRI